MTLRPSSGVLLTAVACGVAATKCDPDANAYVTIPVHVAVEGDASSVGVTLDGGATRDGLAVAIWQTCVGPRV